MLRHFFKVRKARGVRAPSGDMYIFRSEKLTRTEKGSGSYEFESISLGFFSLSHSHSHSRRSFSLFLPFLALSAPSSGINHREKLSEGEITACMSDRGLAFSCSSHMYRVSN